MNETGQQNNNQGGLNFVPKDTYYNEKRTISDKASILGAAIKTTNNGSFFGNLFSGVTGAIKSSIDTVGGAVNAVGGMLKSNQPIEPVAQQQSVISHGVSLSPTQTKIPQSYLDSTKQNTQPPQQTSQNQNKPQQQNKLMNSLIDLSHAMQKGDNIFNFALSDNPQPGQDPLKNFYEKFNTKTEPTASGEAFGKGMLSQLGLGLVSPKTVEYSPKTFSDKMWYTAGTTLGMMAGASAVGGALDLAGTLAKGTKIGEGISGIKAINSATIGRLSRYLDTTAAKPLVEFVVGKVGLENYWNGAVRLAAELGVQNQLTIPANASLQERTMSAAKTAVASTLFSRMGIITNPFTRITAHAAYGTVSTLLESGDYQMAGIQGVTFGLMGAAGGLPENIDAMNRGLQLKSREVIKTIPETHASIGVVDSFVNDIKSGFDIKSDEPIPVSSGKKASPKKKTTSVTLKEVSAATTKINDSIKIESKRNLANLDATQIVNDYNKQKTFSVREILNINSQGDALHNEISGLFSGLETDSVGMEDIAGTSIKGTRGSVDESTMYAPQTEQVINEGLTKQTKSAIEDEIIFNLHNQFPAISESDLPWMIAHHLNRAGTDTGIDTGISKTGGKANDVSLETNKAAQEKKNLNPPTVMQRSALESTARLIASADPEFKSFTEYAKGVKTQHDVWAAYNKMVGEFSAKAAQKVIAEDSQWLDNTKLGTSVDAEKINKIVDLFRQTSGTKNDFLESLARASDLKKTGFTWEPSANKAAKEFGYKSASDMYQDWSVQYKNIFGPIVKMQTAADLINQQVLDTISEHQNNVYEYRSSPEELLGSLDPTKTKISDGKAVSASPSEIKSREQIESELNNLMGIQMRKGIRGKAQGTMYGNILSLKDNNFGVYTHELGHNIDRIINATGSLAADAKTTSPSSEMSKSIIKELLDNASPRVKKNYAPKDWASESFADMIHQYFIGDGVDTQYPLSYQYMRNAVAAHEPALMDALDQRVNDYKLFASSDLVAQVGTSIDGENTPGIMKKVGQDIQDKGVKKVVQDWKDGVKNAYREQINIQSYGADLDKQAGLSGTNSIYHKFDVFFQKAEGIKRWMFEKGTPTADGLKNILDTKPVNSIQNASDGFLNVWGKVKPEHRLAVESYLVIKRYQNLIENGVADVNTLPFEGLKNKASLQDALDKIVAKVPNVDDIANEIARSNADTIKMVAGKNYFNDEVLNKLINLDEQSPYFTSLVRMHSSFDNENPFVVRKNLAMFKQFSGSVRSDFVSPFVSGYSMRSTLVDSVAKTDMLRTLVKFTQRQEAAGKFDHQNLMSMVNNPPMRSTQMTIEEYMGALRASGEFTSEQLSAQEKYWSKHTDDLMSLYRPNTTADKNIYRVPMEDGSTKYIRLADVVRENFDSSVSDGLSNNSVLKAFRTYTSWKRQLTTSLSPVFIVKNSGRDALEAFMNADANFIPVYDQFKGLSSVMKKDDVYWTGSLYGLDHQSITAMDVDSVKQRLVEYAPSNKNGVLDTYGPKAVFRRYVDAMKDLSSMSEAMTRFGVLKKYDINNPEEIIKGIHDSRQATLNWNQHGLKDSAFSRYNSYVAFLKANIIASAKPITVMKEHPVRTLARGSILTGLSFLIGNAAWDNKDYWLQPVQNFMNAVNLPIPKELQKQFPILAGKIMRIPFFGNTWFSTFYGIPQYTMQQMKLKGDPTLTKEWMSQMIGNIVPGIPIEASNAKSVALDFLPDVFKSVGELIMNQSQFSGLPIVPSSLQKLSPEMQYNQYTSEFSVALAKGLAGSFDIHVSPIIMDQLFRDATFSMFDIASSATNIMAQKAGVPTNQMKQDVSVSDLPIISQFLRAETKPSSFWPVSRLYDMYYSSKTFYDTYNALTKTDPVGAVKYYKENMGQIEFMYKGTSRYLAQVKTQIDTYKSIEGNKSLSDSARKSKLESIRNAMVTFSYSIEDQLNSMTDIMNGMPKK